MNQDILVASTHFIWDIFHQNKLLRTPMLLFLTEIRDKLLVQPQNSHHIRNNQNFQPVTYNLEFNARGEKLLKLIT